MFCLESGNYLESQNLEFGHMGVAGVVVDEMGAEGGSES